MQGSWSGLWSYNKYEWVLLDLAGRKRQKKYRNRAQRSCAEELRREWENLSQHWWGKYRNAIPHTKPSGTVFCPLWAWIYFSWSLQYQNTDISNNIFSRQDSARPVLGSQTITRKLYSMNPDLIDALNCQHSYDRKFSKCSGISLHIDWADILNVTLYRSKALGGFHYKEIAKIRGWHTMSAFHELRFHSEVTCHYLHSTNGFTLQASQKSHLSDKLIRSSELVLSVCLVHVSLTTSDTSMYTSKTVQ